MFQGKSKDSVAGPPYPRGRSPDAGGAARERTVAVLVLVLVRAWPGWSCAARVWIVGLDIVYHEKPAFWARYIY
jgi:hypothetical protein